MSPPCSSCSSCSSRKCDAEKRGAWAPTTDSGRSGRSAMTSFNHQWQHGSIDVSIQPVPHTSHTSHTSHVLCVRSTVRSMVADRRIEAVGDLDCSINQASMASCHLVEARAPASDRHGGASPIEPAVTADVRGHRRPAGRSDGDAIRPRAIGPARRARAGPRLGGPGPTACVGIDSCRIDPETVGIGRAGRLLTGLPVVGTGPQLQGRRSTSLHGPARRSAVRWIL